MAREDDRNYVLRYAQRLNITEQDYWLVELAKLLASWSLLSRRFSFEPSAAKQSDFLKSVNDTLSSNGIAFGFKLDKSPETLHERIQKLLIAVRKAKSDREVFVIHLVASWELRRSELDLRPTKDTPYSRSEWGEAETEIQWPRRSVLLAAHAGLCCEEEEAWNSDLDHLGSLPDDYQSLQVAIDNLSEIQLNPPFEMSASIPIDQPVTILVISADPTNASRLRIGTERREVAQALRSTKLRDKYTWRDAPGCRIRDITSALDESKPNILLFTGHGNCQGICFEDEYGNAAIVPTGRLANLLNDQEGLDLVIMNACYSAAQAQSMADAVGHVVGLEGAANDQDAINFSREFFTALGDGRTFEKAFNRARDAIALNQNCTLIPHFLKK